MSMVSQLQVTLPLGNCGLKACSQKVTNTDLVAVTEVLEDVQSDFSDYGIDDDGPSPALQTGNEVSLNAQYYYQMSKALIWKGLWKPSAMTRTVFTSI